MGTRSDLVIKAARAAARTRRVVGLPKLSACCVIDLAEKMGIDVRFVSIPSFEGAYLYQDTATVLISSLRPAGRQAYTCAHEIGHHIFGHGSRFDELQGSTREGLSVAEDEFLCDVFAGFLLMPKAAVENAFVKRGTDPSACSAVEFYSVSQWFGVGYHTLATHSESTLGLINQSRMRDLCRIQPKAIRSTLVGYDCDPNVFLLDRNWTGRAVDAEVGDLVMLQMDTVAEGTAIALADCSDAKSTYRAVAPGVARIIARSGEWSVFVRVRRHEFTGRAIFRHLEEDNE